ncbi:MAG: type II secretion system protein GspC [Desulfobacteraceae bacterium]|nr:type II secretion system protein GspC [Desulfobacteraceae bacterium]
MSYVNTINIKRMVTAVNLALITLIAYFSVALFYRYVGLLVQKTKETAIVANASSPIQSPEAKAVAYYNPIIERDLFKVGKDEKAPDKDKVDPDSLKKTTLDLKLWGTVSGSEDQAYAVIEDNQKREQNLYRVGDTIQNATIKAVLREKVVLSVDGKDEILAMQDLDQTSGAGPMMAARGGFRPQPMEMPQPAATGVREQRITIERTMIDEAFQDVNKLMSDIAVTPHVEEGQTTGLDLNRIQPNSLFRRMGLRNGDVLLGVNGQPILTMEDAMRMYENLRSSENIQLQVKRRGQDRTIDYNIR